MGPLYSWLSTAKKLSIDCLRAGKGIWKHAQALKRHDCVLTISVESINLFELGVNSAGNGLNDQRFLPLLSLFLPELSFVCLASSLPAVFYTMHCRCVHMSMCMDLPSICVLARVYLQMCINASLHVHFMQMSGVHVYWLVLHYRELTD